MAAGILSFAMIGGGGALFAAGALTGNPALMWAGGAMVLSGGAGMLAPNAETSDPTMRGDSPTAQVRDPEQPRSLTYGYCVIGNTITWIENSKSYRGFLLGWECVLCDHSVDSLEGIQFNDHYHVVRPGSSSHFSYGIMSNANRYDELLPSTWYTVSFGNKYRGNDESKKNESNDIPHLGFRLRSWPFTKQNEQWFGSNLFNTYNRRRRYYVGLTVMSVMQFASSTMDTTQMGRIMCLGRWKNNLYDPRSGANAYSSNAILVWMDFLKTRLGLTNANFDMPNVVIEANICEDTSWDHYASQQGITPEHLYTINGQIGDDKDTHDVARVMAMHFLGGWHKRGDQYRPWTGHAMGVLMQITQDDFAGPGWIDPPAEEDWLNTLVPHFVPPKGDDGNLVGRMIPVDTSAGGPVTSATYRTEDAGEILSGDYKLEYCALGRRAEYQAYIRLQELRAGNGQVYTRELKPSVGNRLEVGDVVGIVDPDLWTIGERSWRVFEIIENFDTGTFTVVFRAYDDSIYDVFAQPIEGAVGDIHDYLPQFDPLPYNPVFSWDTPPDWFVDLDQTPDVLSWGTFGVHVTDLAHPEEGIAAYSIAGGAVSWPGQTVYVSYTDGDSALVASTDPTFHAKVGAILLAFWLGGQDVKALFGQVFSDIGLLPDRSIPDSKIIDLSANKLIVNTFIATRIHVGDPVTNGGARIDVDGTNKQIRFYDGQSQNMQRVRIGKLGTLADEYGLEVYSRQGDLIFNADGLDGAYIHDLTVDRLKIKNGALSNAYTSFQSGGFDISDSNDHQLCPTTGNWRDSGTPGLVPYVVCQWEVRLKFDPGNGNSTSAFPHVKVTRSGSIMDNIAVEVGTKGERVSHMFIDTDPLIGSRTYAMQINGSGADFHVDQGQMFLQQILK